MSKKVTNNDPFSQFAFKKSIITSNGTMKAVRFDEVKEAASIDDIQEKGVSLVESLEKGVTGRKDEQSKSGTDGDSQKDVTITAARYPMIPVGYDSVAIWFDLKVVNATEMPHSAKLATYRALKEGVVMVDGEKMNAYDALTCRAEQIFERVANKVFSGDWAWRNKSEATDYRIIIQRADAQEPCSSAEELGQQMFEAFTSGKPALWRVTGVFKLGSGSSLRAYPSQKFLDEKDCNDVGEKGCEKIATYYKIPGTEDFGLRSVKISNRLRAIDEWYGEAAYETLGFPIPVDPMGYTHNLKVALRGTKDAPSAAECMRKIAGFDQNGKKTSEVPELTNEEALYISAITLFGGLITAANKGSEEGGAKKARGGRKAAKSEPASAGDDQQIAQMPII